MGRVGGMGELGLAVGRIPVARQVGDGSKSD
jgi:hypothetical protein